MDGSRLDRDASDMSSSAMEQLCNHSAMDSCVRKGGHDGEDDGSYIYNMHDDVGADRVKHEMGVADEGA
jgi:hypothetical protein